MNAYTIMPADLDAITDVEVAFGTTKLLPKMEQIPADFKERGDDLIYFQIVNSLFCGTPLPKGNVVFNEGFEQGKVVRAARAHIASWEPKHEHKTIGVAYMLKCMCTITPSKKDLE